MIVGIVGEYCCGKKTICRFLEKYYNFTVINNAQFEDDKKIKSHDEDNIQKLNFNNDDSWVSTTLRLKRESIEKISKHDLLNDKLNQSNQSLKHRIGNLDTSCIIYPFTLKDYEKLKSKSTFKLIYLSCSASTRFKNYCKTFGDNATYEDFFNKDDLYNKKTDTIFLKSKANLTLINNSSLEDLYSNLKSLYVQIENNFRPSIDEYFMSIAHLVAERANCIRKKVGCLIVKNNRVLSTGYNGTPSKLENCFLGGCERCNTIHIQGENLDKDLCLHAEESAIAELGKEKCQDATLYTTLYPCLLCTKLIIQAGIIRIVYESAYESSLTESILEKAGVILERHVEQKKIFGFQ